MPLTWDELKAKLPRTRAELHLARTLGLMHRAHGVAEGHNCGECAHLTRKPVDAAGTFWKCAQHLREHHRETGEAWGSAATDWKKSWPSCGLWEARQSPEERAG
jgi:hypothetical protein